MENNKENISNSQPFTYAEKYPNFFFCYIVVV